MSKLRGVFLILISFFFIFALNSNVEAVSTSDRDFDEQIEIAHRNTSFSHWKGAIWSSQSFGPNSRQWLITLYKENETIGHLLVGEDETKQLFVITYGLNEIYLVK